MTETRRDKGKFVKGTSGNPSGRPAIIKEVQELAQAYKEEAIAGLAQIAKNDKAPAQARVAAWNALLDRGYGKPPQAMHIDANVRNDLSDFLEQISTGPRGLPNDSEPPVQ